ncbi:MAG: glycosyltransferase [Bacteroidia bacterium]
MIISIICPILNEEAYIASTIESFLVQESSNFEIEILLIDGMSTDNTRSIIKYYQEKNPNIRLIDNPQRKTPFAFNIGLEQSKGTYVAILGAHCRYGNNYIEACYQDLLKSGSVGCSGLVIPTSERETLESNLVRCILSSPFGVSSFSFRTIGEGYVHSVNFPVFEKAKLVEMGGYNTELHRNQDNAMNQKLIDAGYKLYCTAKTQCEYFIPTKLSKLLRYAYSNGFWNIKSLSGYPRSMKFYHFVPLAFVIGIVGGFLAGALEYAFFSTIYLFVILSGTLILHLTLGLIFSLSLIFRTGKISYLLLPFLFFIFHFYYGYGSLISLNKKFKNDK